MKITNWLSGITGGKGRGDSALIEAVSTHVTKWVGEPIVLHEVRSGVVHVDVYCVPPSEEHPFSTLVTSGMSQRPMNAPARAKSCTHAELVMFLPPGWEMNRESKGPLPWPVRVLKALARYPHQDGKWLWLGHTVPLGDLVPPNVRFSLATLALPLLLDPEQARLVMNDGRSISFFAVVLLYPEERELGLSDGGDRLLEVAEQKDLVEELMILSPARRSLVG